MSMSSGDDQLKAAGSGDPKTVAALLAAGGDVNLQEESGSRRTALMKACRHGHIGVVELLLRHGSAVTAEDANGDTALAYAACNRHMDIVKLLLKHGVDTEKRNSAGRTVLEEVGYKLLAKHELTDEERTEAQKHF